MRFTKLHDNAVLITTDDGLTFELPVLRDRYMTPGTIVLVSPAPTTPRLRCLLWGDAPRAAPYLQIAGDVGMDALVDRLNTPGAAPAAAQPRTPAPSVSA